MEKKIMFHGEYPKDLIIPYGHHVTLVYMFQLQLLSNGFRLLKVGGSLVYSTCRCIFPYFSVNYNALYLVSG